MFFYDCATMLYIFLRLHIYATNVSTRVCHALHKYPILSDPCVTHYLLDHTWVTEDLLFIATKNDGITPREMLNC